MTPDDVYDLRRLSDEELRQLEYLLTKAQRAPQATANPSADEGAQLARGRAIGAQWGRDVF